MLNNRNISKYKIRINACTGVILIYMFYQHMSNNKDHVIGFEEVEILDSADNDTKLRIKELLHILKRKPELNKQLGTESNYEIKT